MSKSLNTFLCLFCIFFSLPNLLQAQESDGETRRKAVLITGASSGIGLRTTEVLAANGFHVYAGARKQADLDRLEAMEHVTAVRLDVTVQAEIDAAVAFVEAQGRGLHGLINNAGVVLLAPLIEVSEEDLDFQMDVNVFGPYRVTKAFAPLLIESKGRISTTGSISGFATWGFGGPYTMSKHATEAFTDVLQAELRSFGVSVSIVEPGNFKSRITANMKERLEQQGYNTEGSRYKAALDGLFSGPMARAQYKEPDAVAEAFLHAMRDAEPKLRYMVVPNQQEAALTIQSTLKRVVELNEEHEYSYSRDELVAMLDALLEQQGSKD
ncbi:MAG: SDR family oxidoreductase [Planctomycetota bacterium]